MSVPTTLSAALLLFLVMDPLGNVPLFLSALDQVAPERRRRVLVRELLIALASLLLFIFFGGTLLGLLGIRTESLRVAGGIILFLIALRMIFPGPNRHAADDVEGEPFIVPLAIPFVAGPSAFATLLLLGQADGASLLSLMVSLLLAWAASAVILLLAEQIGRILGRRGLIAIERLMGMLLVALSVQMFLDGAKSVING
jgi:multiple antibiotic resistance protein